MQRLLLLPVAAVALLAGCASTAAPLSGGPATNTSPAAPTDAATTGPTTTGVAATGVAATGAAATGAATAECKVDQLAMTITGGDAGSTHRSRIVLFRNTGSATCFLRGYPGAAALDAKGKQVAQAKRTIAGYLGGLRSGRPPRVDLAPGATGSAMVEATAATSAGNSCTAYAGLLVTPPDETHSVRLTWGSDGCANLEIHPVVPGSTGSK